MADNSWRSRFWWQWIVANSLAEFVGLGVVAALAFLFVTQFGEPQGLQQSLLFAALFVLLGAFEGLVVGWAQARVLRQRVPELQGWVRASIIGALVAWAMGMVPSTIMNVVEPASSGPPPEIGEFARILLAASLGFAAGPVLAFFQWRVLRRYVRRRAGWWLPANAAAWALGMPIIFAAAHLGAASSSPIVVVLGVAVSLLGAGAVVGAVHGRVLAWLLMEQK